jgi:hypothetical protein
VDLCFTIIVDRSKRKTTEPSEVYQGVAGRAEAGDAPGATRNPYYAVKEGAGIGLAVDEHLLFNPSHAIVNDLPLDVLGQLTRPDGPAYSHKQMVLLAREAQRQGRETITHGWPVTYPLQPRLT